MFLDPEGARRCVSVRGLTTGMWFRTWFSVIRRPRGPSENSLVRTKRSPTDTAPHHWIPSMQDTHRSPGVYVARGERHTAAEESVLWR